jgi:hypothetical protein
LQPEEEMCIASEAIEFRDDQRCLADPAFGQRTRELRAVGALAAFDLNKLRDRLRAEAGEI